MQYKGNSNTNNNKNPWNKPQETGKETCIIESMDEWNQEKKIRKNILLSIRNKKIQIAGFGSWTGNDTTPFKGKRHNTF